MASLSIEGEDRLLDGFVILQEPHKAVLRYILGDHEIAQEGVAPSRQAGVSHRSRRVHCQMLRHFEVYDLSLMRESMKAPPFPADLSNGWASSDLVQGSGCPILLAKLGRCDEHDPLRENPLRNQG